jgi:hypothetical protein
VQPRPGSLAPEELSDDDLLEVSTIPPAEAAGPPEAAPEAPPEIVVSVSSEVELEEERPPSSSRRSKVAETLDEALASAAQMEQEEEREVPVKTPPPESGPQEAAAPLPGGLEAPGVPDVEGLEADMLGPPSMGPTAEQLGETIELEAPRGPELEIDVAADGALGGRPEAPPEELEVALPRAPMPSGTYDVPAEAAAEIIQPAEPQAPAVEAAPENLGPERTVRAQHGATDVARVVLAPSTAPKNFVELLDVSLGL